jgi:tripartite-type tricarboxylate transporter receptor subunit TctC
LRALAYGAARPSPRMPDVPMISAVIPGFAVNSWFGIAGPGNMPPAVRAGWLAALHAVGRNPEFQRRMAENAMEIIMDDPTRFRATIAQDRAKWAEVIRAANIRAE